MVDLSSVIDQISIADERLTRHLKNEEGLSPQERDIEIVKCVEALQRTAGILMYDKDLNSTNYLCQILDILSGQTLNGKVETTTNK